MPGDVQKGHFTAPSQARDAQTERVGNWRGHDIV